MDKFFIQNAFKTLDEIEEEISCGKNPLRENFTNSLNEKLDADELADKYCGEIFDLGDEPVQVVSILTFGGSFKKSTWKIITLEGKYKKVCGEDLKPHVYKGALNEKLPRDPAAAYDDLSDSEYGIGKMYRNKHETQYNANYRKAKYFPQSMPRKEVTIDFDKANYTDISNDDREQIIKKYKEPGERCKLRLLYNAEDRKYIKNKNKSVSSAHPVVLMWDENNNPITSPAALLDYRFNDKWARFKEEGKLNINKFSDLVKGADKIYVTDEDKHKREVTPEVNIRDRYFNDLLKKLDHKDQETRRYVDSANSYVNIGSDLTDRFGDTGDHNSAWAKRKARDLQNLKDKTAEWVAHGKGTQRADMYKPYFKRAQYLYNNTKHTNRNDKGYCDNRINYNLTKFKLLKEIAKQLKQSFMSVNSGDTDQNIDLYYSDYQRLLRKKAELEAKVTEIVRELKTANDELAKVTAEVNSPEITDAYENMVNDKLERYCNDYKAVVSDFKELRDKLGLSVNKKIHESFEANELRIYTRNNAGLENFVDDFTNDEEAKVKYQELVDSGDYEQVCLVKVSPDTTEVILNSQECQDECEESLDEKVTDKRSLGQIIDDRLKAKNECIEKDQLKESKSFNLKDPENVADAKAYKAVGEQSSEELIVVDPSMESANDDIKYSLGNDLLKCPSCMAVFPMKPEDIKKDEDGLYNAGMPCPHCGQEEKGFELVGQIAASESQDAHIAVEEGKEDSVEEKPEEKETLPEVDDNFVDIDDVDEIKEESFENLVNPYLTKLYENVDSFKTTKIEQTGRDKIIIEGNLKSKSGKEKLVEFLFKIKQTKPDSIILEGYNKILTDKENAFKLTGKLENKAVIFESFEYNYNKEVDGNQILIEGIEK